MLTLTALKKNLIFKVFLKTISLKFSCKHPFAVLPVLEDPSQVLMTQDTFTSHIHLTRIYIKIYMWKMYYTAIMPYWDIWLQALWLHGDVLPGLDWETAELFLFSYSNEHFWTFTLKVAVRLRQWGTYKYTTVIFKLVPLCEKMQRFTEQAAFVVVSRIYRHGLLP